MPSEWLTSKEAARRLGVSAATLYAYVSRGLLRSEGSNGQRERRYRADDVSRLKRRREVGRKAESIAANALDFGIGFWGYDWGYCHYGCNAGYQNYSFHIDYLWHRGNHLVELGLTDRTPFHRLAFRRLGAMHAGEVRRSLQESDIDGPA